MDSAFSHEYIFFVPEGHPLPEGIVGDRPNPKRIQVILNYIRVAWQQHPDMRLGQLLSNLASLTDDLDPPSIWNLADEKLIPAVRKLLKAVVAKPDA